MLFLIGQIGHVEIQFLLGSCHVGHVEGIVKLIISLIQVLTLIDVSVVEMVALAVILT